MLRRKKKKGPVQAAPTAEELALLARVLRHYPEGTKLNFGAPVRCPECGDFGMVSGVDQYAGVASYFCMRCGIEWDLSRRAIRSAPTMPERVTVGGLGPLFEQVQADLAPAPVDVAIASDLHLLLVEDEPADAELVKMIFSTTSLVDLAHASSRREGEAIASGGGVDLVLLDLGLPESSGLSTLSTWRVATPPSPIVVVSGDNRPGLVDSAKQIGAADFLHKQQLLPLLDRGAEGTAELVDHLRHLVAAERAAPAVNPPPAPGPGLIAF